MKVYVNITDFEGRVRRFPVGQKPIKVGRNEAAQVSVDDCHCSGFHLMLHFDENGLHLEDLKSKNGTMLNGIKIFKQKMYIGDKVVLGDTTLEIDTEKTDPSVLKILSPAQKRSHGEITLQLENSKFNPNKSHSRKISSVPGHSALPNSAGKNSVRNSKLYEGSEEMAKEKSQSQKSVARNLVIREYFALAIDALITLVVCAGVFSATKAAKPDLENYIYAFAGIVGGMVFAFWNRKRDSGSIGEKVMGI